MFRNSPPEVFFKEEAQQNLNNRNIKTQKFKLYFNNTPNSRRLFQKNFVHCDSFCFYISMVKQTYMRTKMRKCDLNKATSELYWNHTQAAHLQSTLLRENASGGLLLHVKRTLKDFSYKKFLFTTVKRKLLTLKMNK